MIPYCAFNLQFPRWLMMLNIFSSANVSSIYLVCGCLSSARKKTSNVLLYGSFCIGTWVLLDNVILQKTESVVQLEFFFIFHYLCVCTCFLVCVCARMCVYTCLCVIVHVCYSVHVDVTGQLQMSSLPPCLRQGLSCLL